MDMSSSNSTMTDMPSMISTFFTSTTTSLFSSAWTPTSTGQYAGTCIFLIVLATIFRGLFALRAVRDRLDAQVHGRYVKVAGKKESDSTRMMSNQKAAEGDPTATTSKHAGVRPWRISTDVPRALLDTIIAGVGYLLMLAVMTNNVGYFLSILGGTFLGSLMVGRYGN
ncbi:hypothetical protein MMC28_003306 [Mycoblastus sanguinarius]|nr:hypothetical protein [Mycoblastus sanguinarius]